MARPAVGAPLLRCPSCSGYEYGGAPECPRCAKLVDEIIEEEWASFIDRLDAGREDHIAVARMVADDPEDHDWRVVDAALDRLACAACGARLSRGPVGCSPCDLAHGFRYAARETDRPGVPAGNEHAVRVNVSVLRRPHITSSDELLARRLLLPVLLVGRLPTTQQAQQASAKLKDAPASAKLAIMERAVEDLLRGQPPGGSHGSLGAGARPPPAQIPTRRPRS